MMGDQYASRSVDVESSSSIGDQPKTAPNSINSQAAKKKTSSDSDDDGISGGASSNSSFLGTTSPGDEKIPSKKVPTIESSNDKTSSTLLEPILDDGNVADDTVHNDTSSTLAAPERTKKAPKAATETGATTTTTTTTTTNTQLNESKKRASLSSSSPGSTKKKKVAIGNEVYDDPTKLKEDPMILNLVLVWLMPTDIAKATQVCKNWNKGIAQYTWKTGIENVGGNGVVACRALELAMGEHLSHKAVAKGLASRSSDQDEKKKKQKQKYPTPSISSEDIFLLVEVQCPGGGAGGAWCKSLRGYGKNNIGQPRVEFADEDTENLPPIEFELSPEELYEWNDCIPYFYDDGNFNFDLRDDGAMYLFDKMDVTISLWRRDTGQTFYLCKSRKEHTVNRHYEATYADNAGFGVQYHFDCCKDHTRSLDSQDCYFGVDDSDAGFGITDMASSAAGCSAKYLCQTEHYRFMNPKLFVTLEPVLPSAGSTEEPAWLKEARAKEKSSLNFATKGELMGFLSAENFKYRVVDMSIDFRFCVGGGMYGGGDDDSSTYGGMYSDRDFVQEDRAINRLAKDEHFLLFLEGLNWE